MIGDEVLDVAELDIEKDNNYLFLRHVHAQFLEVCPVHTTLMACHTDTYYVERSCENCSMIAALRIPYFQLYLTFDNTILHKVRREGRSAARLLVKAEDRRRK